MNFQGILFFGGCVLLSFGAVLGFPYWLAQRAEKPNAEAWRVAHAAITAGAVGIMVLAAGYKLLRLPAWAEAVLVFSSLISGYGFGTGSTISALTAEGPRSRVVVLFYVLGALGSTVAGPLLVYGAYANLVAR